jgi:hypothetical protein
MRLSPIVDQVRAVKIRVTTAMSKKRVTALSSMNGSRNLDPPRAKQDWRQRRLLH